jgi:hypothetical protein
MKVQCKEHSFVLDSIDGTMKGCRNNKMRCSPRFCMKYLAAKWEFSMAQTVRNGCTRLRLSLISHVEAATLTYDGVPERMEENTRILPSHKEPLDIDSG